MEKLGLDEIRILEDLKSEYDDLSQKYNSMSSSYINGLMNKVADEFVAFFNKAKFSINRYSSSVIAHYGHSTADLNYDKPWSFEEADIGMTLGTNFASQNYRKYIVALNKAPSDQKHVETPQNIYEEIEIIKMKIEELKMKIATETFEQYHLYVKPEEYTNAFDSYLKPYNSLTDFLIKITS